MVGDPLGSRDARALEADAVGSGEGEGVVGEGVPDGVTAGTAVGVGLQPLAKTRRRASTADAGRL
jgi:hypothetical protein